MIIVAEYLKIAVNATTIIKLNCKIKSRNLLLIFQVHYVVIINVTSMYKSIINRK